MKTKKKQKNKQKQLSLTVIIAAVAIVGAITGAAVIYRNLKIAQTPAQGPLSRQVMVYAELEVAMHRIPPPLAALQYAYIAGAYADGLQSGGQSGGLTAARALFDQIYPDITDHTDSTFGTLAAMNHVSDYAKSSRPSVSTAEIIAAYLDRYQNDGHTLTWNGTIPKGNGKWVDVTDTPPISPRAGEWKRWVVSTPIQAPAPPIIGSIEDNRQLFIVRQAVAGRTGADVQLINFWAGSIGTATPSGIWQDKLFKTAGKDISRNAIAADKSYAVVQKNIALTMSDAFMECWKVKYTYWTARPDQRMPGLKTGMPDPNFPSYISGHSTVSKAAADVLGVMVPRYKDQWEAMAAQARYSRLVAGIHFDIDNSVGFTVGANIASQSIAHLRLSKVM